MEDLTYRRLLDWYYLHETPIPLDESEVARQIRMRSHSDCITVVLREYFERTADGWIHHRADKELAKAGDKSVKASESAKARWAKQKDANALQTQSEGNATHNTLHITQDTVKEKTPRKSASILKPDDVEQAVWDDFLAIRKAKRSPMTGTALSGIRREASKAGWSLESALKECVSRGWQGFKSDWIEKKQSASDKNRTFMAEVTRGLAAPKNFWEKDTLEVEDVQRKRLL